MPKPQIHQIVLLGAGYGGLRTALDLAQSCRRHGLERRIILVDRGHRHQLITRLHQVATDSMPADEAALPIVDLLPPGAVEILQGDVESIDPQEKSIQIDGEKIFYDRLVIALGSEAAAPPIPGLQENSLPLRWWQDAIHLKDHLEDAFAAAGRAADPETRQSWLRIAMVGGGSTGCQIAGEIAHWVTGLADAHQVPVGEIHLLLLESEPTLLQECSPAMGEKAATVLRRKGIDVRCGSPLESVGQESLRFRGEEFPCRTVIWTGGIQGHPLLAGSGFEVDERGKLLVDERLRLREYPEIYAVGDAVTFEVDGEPLPATAAVALRQGAYVATALSDEIIGRPPRPFQPRDLGLLVSLGGGDAIGVVLGVPLEGSAAGLVKESVERWYLATVTRKLPLVDL